jgi:hypothetical protein
MDIDRTKRIKEARDEAKKEITAYRSSKEAEFKKFEAEVRVTRPTQLWFPYAMHDHWPYALPIQREKSAMAQIVVLT